MSNWNFQKVKGDEINVKNYIIDVFFELNTTYSNYIAYYKGNENQKRVIFAGIISLYTILRNYKAVRTYKDKDSKNKFDNKIQQIEKNGTLENSDIKFCVEMLSNFMFMAGFTDINWEFKDFEKSL